MWAFGQKRCPGVQLNAERQPLNADRPYADPPLRRPTDPFPHDPRIDGKEKRPERLD